VTGFFHFSGDRLATRGQADVFFPGERMRNRATRTALLAVLLMVVAPAIALAAGLQGGKVSCCCAHGTASPEVQARFDAPSCCKMSDGDPVPSTVPVTVSTSFEAPAVALHDIAVGATAALVSHDEVPGLDSGPGKRPPRSLFTLNEAFLI